jgi:hypothetical protein
MMAARRSNVPIPILLVVALLVPVSAAGERFADLYGGWAFTQDDHGADTESTRPIVTDDAEFDDSPVVGVRLGAWLEAQRHLGGALDLSFFSPDGSGGYDGVDLRAYLISALLMARLPLLASDAHPNGRLQPYLAVGPSFQVTEMKVTISPTHGNARDTSIDPGLDARLGATFLFAPGFGLFLEYRFTYFEPDLEDIKRGVEVNLKPELQTHSAQIGLTFRY